MILIRTDKGDGTTDRFYDDDHIDTAVKRMASHLDKTVEEIVARLNAGDEIETSFSYYKAASEDCDERHAVADR